MSEISQSLRAYGVAKVGKGSAIAVKERHGEEAHGAVCLCAQKADSMRAGKVPHGGKRYVSLAN